MAADVLLVIPAFREVRRLPPYLRDLLAVLSPARFTTEILIVEDGSPSGEQQELLSALSLGTVGACRVLEPVFLPENRGKGHTIIQGWRSGGPARWFGFVDADGAVPAYEVLRLLDLALHMDSTPPSCVWASRQAQTGKKIRRSLGRRLLGRLFAGFVSRSTGLRVYDPQCGFKLIPDFYYQKIAPLLQESRFCFDIELLLAVCHAGADIVEVPIDWRDVPGGQLHPLRDGMAMLSRLPAIRRRAKSWPSVA
jgi:dolichyl-phosphate beta-glucosyltransferase